MKPDQITVKTPEFVSLAFQLAGLGSRAGAMIIDQLLLLIVNIVIVLFLNLMQVAVPFNDLSFALAFVIILLFGLRWAYFFIAEYFFGGKTIGKRMLGIRVIQENGHSITLLSSLIRNLLRIIDMLPTAYFIGIIMVFLHGKHKRLGDIVAGTIVVHEKEADRKKERPVDDLIASKGLTKESIHVDDLAIRSLGKKEWQLLKAYSERLPQMSTAERRDRTQEVAGILLPKVNLRVDENTTQDLESALLVLYLILRDEWEFEL